MSSAKGVSIMYEQIKIRSANSLDSLDLYNWRNDPTTRKMFFSSDLISIQNHQKWFKKALASKNFLLLIGEINKSKLGVCRFEFSIIKNTAEVSINLNPNFRGLGLGGQLLERCISHFIERYPIKLIAKIKKNNLVSQRIFKKSNFIQVQNSSNIIEMILEP